MPNAIVYIDGFNLYYGAVRNTPYRWLNLETLCQRMLPHDPQAPLRQQIYLRALRTLPSIKTIFGHFLTHSVPMTLTGVTPRQRVWGR